MKIVIMDIFLKQTWKYLNIYMIYTVIYNFYRKVCNLYDKNDYVVHISDLEQVLNHGLLLRKVQGVIQFNQKVWLKGYIDMNSELRKQTKSDFEKDFIKLMNNSIFGNTMENVRNHRDIKLQSVTKYLRLTLVFM